MTEHDPERDAAAFISGEMDPEERARFEDHLLSCETCWREISLDREGRRLAESIRESAPEALRDAVRTAVLEAADADRGADRGKVVALWRAPALKRRRSIAVVVAAASLVAAVLLPRSGTPSPVVDAAVAAYEHADVEAHHDQMPAPDLAGLGLRSVGATHMALGGTAVEAFAYRSSQGSRLTLFMAGSAFQPPPGATLTVGGWHAIRGGIDLMCADQPIPFLAVTSDPVVMSSFEGGLAQGTIKLV